MSSLVTTHRRTAGTVLASQGEPVADVMVVTSGVVAGWRTNDDGSTSSWVGRPGWVIGAEGSQPDRGHLWSVSAISDVEIQHCIPGGDAAHDWGVVR